MVDRRFDLDIGLKSSAILFANRGPGQSSARSKALRSPCSSSLACRPVSSHAFFAALVAAGGLFVYHQWLIREREESACFKAFRNNVWVGFALFAGAAIEYQALA